MAASIPMLGAHSRRDALICPAALPFSAAGALTGTIPGHGGYPLQEKKKDIAMKTKFRFFAVVSLGLSMVATSLTPAAAFNVPVPIARPSADVEQVQYRPPPPHYRGDWPRDRRYNWQQDNRARYGWYKGHRGYRDYRPGYRRHSDGYWYPLAAFAIGAIIGGAMNAPRAAPRMTSSHVRWCESRYRTYRAYDNTYVPRAGVRAQCMSPYR